MSIRFILQISTGIVRDTTMRRRVMFYVVLGDLLLLFAGSTFLQEWLSERPLLFIGFWLVCAWLTVLVLLMAMFDLLMVRKSARRERARLVKEYLNNEAPTKDEDPG